MSGLWAAGGAILGGVIASSGAKSAAKTQAGAANQATQAQLQQFEQTREDYAPWLAAGERGLAKFEEIGAAPSRVLEGDYIPKVNNFQFGAEEFNQYQDPGYQWRLQQGEQGVNRAFASMGKLGSGNRLRGLMELNQNMASQEFGAARGRALEDYGTNQLAPYERGVAGYGRAYSAEGDYLNRLASLSNVGQSAVGSITAATPNLSPNYLAAGQATAAGQLGSTGAWSGALGDLGRQFRDYQRAQAQPQRDYGIFDTGGAYG